MPGTVLHSQAQQFVLNLCEYFERERAHGGPILPLSSFQERVADALKISRKTVYNIKKRNENKPIPSTPGKSRHRPKKNTADLPEGQKMAVRNTLYDMYKESERLIQFASENLVTEILIHPVVSTLAQCIRNLLSSFTRHRHIIHSGYTFAANGSWALQDGTFSYSDFSEAFQEIDVQRVIHTYENGISLDLHCSPEGEWTRLPKEQFAKACKARVNPTDILTSGSPAIASFTNYLAPFLVPTTLENLLESSDVVGNIRFSRPTLYVFPGGQGDAALFGINGFNMLLDGGFSRKACFWDFVRHLDRLDAVLMTRLNNSNVGGIGSVLRRKKQDAVYPQLGHFFCNIQERRALLSPDGDKDKDPLLINLLDEGQEIISNLRHLNLNPQVCYRDSEPINLYHKVGHGTLDMYVLSPAKDSNEVRQFLQKWNQCDQKLFANSKSSREFNFPIQNLISIAALLVWQPADPNDTITRILFPGSSPQNKIFEGLDRLKNLEFVKHSVCTERSLVPISITKKTAKDPILEKVTPKEKTLIEKKDNKIIENNIISAVNGDIKEKDKIVKKSDSTESNRSTKAKKTEEPRITENGDKSKPKLRTSKSRSGSQQRKKTVEKKASPTTPKKIVENGESKKPSKPSPISTPAKSTKDANNRKVLESKAKREGVVKPQQPPEPKPKVERKPISRRPVPKKAPLSPAKKLVSGVQKPDSISRRGKLDKEGTTDSSTVSTPSADQETVLKKDLSKLTPDEIQQLKAQELADLKEEQEAIKEIEAVFRKGESLPLQDETLRKVRDDLIDEKLNKEEYLIVEKEEVEHESLSDTKENETQKLARDSEESEKQRKLSIEEKVEDISADIKKESEVEDIVKTKVDALESSKVSLEDKFEISTDKKTNGKEADDDVKDVMESQPDEKISANIKSGDTTTAPTLSEDERIPLDEIKEDTRHAIEEKYVKEETKEKEIPVIQLPQKQHESISKLPGTVGIRLDKQHIRDIVKTPDEVADLPVHEEVDYEFTHELKAETPKSNEIVEKQFEDHPETTKYSKEQKKEVEQEKDKDEVIQETTEQIENVSSIPESELKIVKYLEKDEKRKSLDGKDESRGKPEHQPTTKDVGVIPSEAETLLDGFQSTKKIVESHDEQQYEKVLELKETKPSEDNERQNVENGIIESKMEKSAENTKHVPSESVEGAVPEKREEDNISILPTVIEVKSELDRINEGVLKAAKEDRYHLEKLDEKLQHLKQLEAEEDERHFSTIQSIKSVDISEEVEKSIEETTDDIMEDFTREVVAEKSLQKSPIEMIEKVELGRKSPKEREDDVIKIVASVAEVLKSDAPLEEFEGKLPITTTIGSYISPYTTELRETHITTVDSPVIEYKVIKTDIPTIPEEPHIASASFIEEEKKISDIHDSREEKSEDKRSSLLKESQELMMTTSRMISDIKSAKPEELAKKDVLAGEVDVDSIIVTDEKIEEEESGIIHRMLVTASSEDGGEETEICPPGTIIFPRSSESSGRSSPDPSQKISQKSSVVETISVSTVKQVAELQSEKESGMVGKSEEIISPLPELKTAELSDGLSAALEKSKEISSQIMTSGKSSPDKDASIKSLASGKSTPDMSELEKFKEVTSSSEDLKKEGDGRSIKESHSDKSVSETPVDGKDVKTQTIATTEQTVVRLEQLTPEGTSKSGVDPRQSVVDVVEDTVERGIAAVTEFTKSIFISDEGYDENVSEHIADKEITEGVNATRSVILVAKDGPSGDKLSHDDTSKVFKEPEVPEIIQSIGEDEHTAEVEESQEGILVGVIGSSIGDAFDVIAEYMHPAKDQIDITEIIEKETEPEKVKETAAPKSAEIEFTKEQKEVSPPTEKQEDLYASHEASHSSQDTHGKIDVVIAQTKDTSEKIGEELKVSLEETDKMKKDLSDPLNAKVIPQEHLISEHLTEADKSSSEESVIVSKSPVAIEVFETIVSSGEPSEHVQLNTEIEDSKLVLEAVHKVIGSTEIIKIPETEIEPAESMSKSVNDLPKEIEGVVEEIPSTEKTMNDIPEREISKTLDSSEISASKLEEATTLGSTTANDISDESDLKTNIISTDPRKDEEQLAKLTEKIDSSPEKQKHFTSSSDMYGTKKLSADDIPVESDHKIKNTSTIVSEQLDVAELGISNSKLIEKATKDDEQTAEQTTETDSSLEKQRLVIDDSPEISARKIPDADESDHENKFTSTTVSEQLYEAEAKILKDKPRMKEKQPVEQFDSSTDKNSLAADGSPEIDVIVDESDNKTVSRLMTMSELHNEAESDISKDVSVEKQPAESTQQIDLSEEKRGPITEGFLETHKLKKLSNEISTENLLTEDNNETPGIVPGATKEDFVLKKSEMEEDSITVKISEDAKKVIFDGEQSQVTPKEITETHEDEDKSTKTEVVLEVVKHDLQNIAEKVSGVITSEVECTGDKIDILEKDVKISSSSLYEEVKDISKGMLDEAKKMFDETSYSITSLLKDTDNSVETLKDVSSVMQKTEDFENISIKINCPEDVKESVVIEPTQVAHKLIQEGQTDPSEGIEMSDDSRSVLRESISFDKKHEKSDNEESKQTKSTPDPQKDTSNEISILPLSGPSKSKEFVMSSEMKEPLEYGGKDEEVLDVDFEKLEDAIEQHKEGVKDISDPHLLVSKDKDIDHEKYSVDRDLKSKTDEKIPEFEKIAIEYEQFTKCIESGDEGSESHISPDIKTPEPDGEEIFERKIHKRDTGGGTTDLESGNGNVSDVADIPKRIIPFVKETIESIIKYEEPHQKDKLESKLENTEGKISEKEEIFKNTTEKVEDMNKSIILEKSQMSVTEVEIVDKESSKKGGLPRIHYGMEQVTEDDPKTTEVISKSEDSGTVDSGKSESPKPPTESGDAKKDIYEFVEDLKLPIITSGGILETGIPETGESTKTEKSVVESTNILEREHTDISDLEQDETHEQKKILTPTEKFETTDERKKSSEIHEGIETAAKMIKYSGKSAGEILDREKAVLEEYIRETVGVVSAVSKTCESGNEMKSDEDLDEKLKDESQYSEGETGITNDKEISHVTDKQVLKDQPEDLKLKFDGVEEQLISDDSIKISKEEQYGKADAEKDVDEIEGCKNIAESMEVKLEESASDLEKIFATVQDLSRSVIFETCDSRDGKDDDQKLRELPKQQEKMSKDPSEESMKSSEHKHTEAKPENKKQEFCEKSDEEKYVDGEKKSDQIIKDGATETYDSVDSEILIVGKVTGESKKGQEEKSESDIEITIRKDKKADTESIPQSVVFETCETKEKNLSNELPSTEMTKEVHYEKSGTDEISKHKKAGDNISKSVVLETDQVEKISDSKQPPPEEVIHGEPGKLGTDTHHELSYNKTEVDIGMETKHEKSLLEKSDKFDVEMKVGVCPIFDKVIKQEYEKTSRGLHNGFDEEQIDSGKKSKQEGVIMEELEKRPKDTSEGFHSLVSKSCEEICKEPKEITMDTHHDESDVGSKVSQAEESEKTTKDTPSPAQVLSQSIVTKKSEGVCEEHAESADSHLEKSDIEKKIDSDEINQEKILECHSEAVQGISPTAVPEKFEGICEETVITSEDVKPHTESKVFVDPKSDNSTEQESESLKEPGVILKDALGAIQGISKTIVSEGAGREHGKPSIDIHYEKSDTEKQVDEGIESKQGEPMSKKSVTSLEDAFDVDISQSVAVTKTTGGACQKIHELSTDVPYEKPETRKLEIDPKSDEVIGKSYELSEDTSEAVKDTFLSLVNANSVGICGESGKIPEDIYHEKSDAEKIFDVYEKSNEEESILEKPEKLLKDSSEHVQVLSQSVISESCKNTDKSDITDGEKSDPEKHVEIASESSEHMEKVVTPLEKSPEELKGISERTADMSRPIVFAKCDYAGIKSTTDEATLEKQEDAPTKNISEMLGHVGDISKFLESERTMSVADISTRKSEKREGVDTEECTEKCIEPCQKCSDTKEQDAKTNIISSTIEKIGYKSAELEKGEDETMEKCDKECEPESSTTQQSIIPNIANQKPGVHDLEETPITLAGPSTAIQSKTEVQKQIEIQETLLHEKHIPGTVTPPTVPVSPNILNDTMKFTTGSQAAMKEVDYRSITPVSDDSEIIGSTHTDISEQVSKVHLDKESDDDDQLSIMSQIAHSRESSHCEFDDEFRKVDPMSMSLYGSIPVEMSSEQDSDLSIPVETGKTKYLAPYVDKTNVDLAESVDYAKTGSSPIYDASSSSMSQEKKDPLESWEKPLELPAPTYLYEITQAKFSRAVHSTSPEGKLSAIEQQSESAEEENHHFRHEQLDVMSASFYGDLPTDEKDPLSSWGKPLGLPSPAPPNDNKGTPKKERKLPPNVSAKNKLNDDRKRAESPSKYNNRNKKITPVYVDLTYVPHHGNTNYSYIDFFKRVRARYYVFSGIEPSRDVYNALLEAKQTWEDKELEVTIIPTYDTDILGYWVAENEEMLSKYKIDLSPSASRCTINLQDHETSCSAYRLEF